jgi:hypothetical protein
LLAVEVVQFDSAGFLHLCHVGMSMDRS